MRQLRPEANQRQLKSWLEGPPCVGLRAQGNEWNACSSHSAEEREGHSVLIGSKRTHPSHTLAWKRGVWFCVRCGAYAEAVPVQKSTCLKLSASCVEATSSGRAALDKIANGTPPRHGMRWHLDLEAVVPMCGTELNELWPDRRLGSRGARKRRPADDEHHVSAPRHSDAVPAPESDQLLGFVREQEIVVEQCQYLLQEDEDP